MGVTAHRRSEGASRDISLFQQTPPHTHLPSPTGQKAKAFPSVGFMRQESQCGPQVQGEVGRPGDITVWLLLTSGLAEFVESMLAFPEQPKWIPLATLGQGVVIKGDGPSSQQPIALEL